MAPLGLPLSFFYEVFSACRGGCIWLLSRSPEPMSLSLKGRGTSRSFQPSSGSPRRKGLTPRGESAFVESQAGTAIRKSFLCCSRVGDVVKDTGNLPRRQAVPQMVVLGKL